MDDNTLTVANEAAVTTPTNSNNKMSVGNVIMSIASTITLGVVTFFLCKKLAKRKAAKKAAKKEN